MKVKNFLKKLKIVLLVIVIIFLLVCVADFFRAIEITSRRPTVIIGGAAILIGIFWAWYSYYSMSESLKHHKKKEESFISFYFPRTHQSYSVFGRCEKNYDLVRLAEDYHLAATEEAFDYLVSCAVSDAAEKYREKNPIPQDTNE